MTFKYNSPTEQHPPEVNILIVDDTPANPAVLTFTLVVTGSLGLAGPSPDEVVVTVERQTLPVFLPLILKNP